MTSIFYTNGVIFSSFSRLEKAIPLQSKVTNYTLPDQGSWGFPTIARNSTVKLGSQINYSGVDTCLQYSSSHP